MATPDTAPPVGLLLSFLLEVVIILVAIRVAGDLDPVGQALTPILGAAASILVPVVTFKLTER